jgi:phosphoglycerate dehydrogenase-like enzyme
MLSDRNQEPAMPTPKIYVATGPELYQRIFTPQHDSALRECGEVHFNPDSKRLSSAELGQRLRGFDAVVTGWGTPKFTDEVLNEAKALKLIAHSAGTVKSMLPVEVFERGIAVTHAAAAIAPAVAEYSLMLTMLMLKGAHPKHETMRVGEWGGKTTMHEISGTRIGVIAASYTGRFFIKLLKAVGAEVVVYDPYLKDEQARELGVQKAELDELFTTCPVVSMQAPVTEQTHRMIGKAQLSKLRDGGILINTARSLLVDQDALLAELKTGRISAALDVFDEEPLAADSPFRKLPNVFLTPHIAGASAQSLVRQGQFMVEEVQRFFKSGELKYRVTAKMLPTMA